jgi:peptidoglycan lytic transglycosylase D
MSGNWNRPISHSHSTDYMDTRKSNAHRIVSMWLVFALGICLVTAQPCPADERAASGYFKGNYILPPELAKKGISWAGERIPLKRPGVNKRVVDQINFLLMDRRAVLMEWFDRMAEHGPAFRKVLKEEKVPKDLIYLPVLLSGLLPNARSRSGGVGWWALTSDKKKPSSTGKHWIVTNDWDDRRDPVISTRIACTLLQSLRRRKETGDWLLAVCAYVDGSESVAAAVKKSPGFSYWDIVMPHYSEIIIPRLVALKIIDSHRDYYGVDVPKLRAQSFDSLDRLKLLKDLPLYVVAKWCSTDPRSIWELNPGVDPSTGTLPKPDLRNPSGFPLRVPKGKGRLVMKRLKKEGYLPG